MKIARHRDYTVFLKDKAQLLHEQTQTSPSLTETELYKDVIKVIKTNVQDKKNYSDLSTVVIKLAAYSVFRLVPSGKQRHLTAMLVVCSSAWQNESGKSGVKKGTVARAAPEASQPLVGEEDLVEKDQFSFAPVMTAQLVT